MLDFELLVQYGSMILHSELLQNQEELQHHWCAGTDFRCFTTSHPSWPLLLTVPFSCNKAVLYCIRRLLTCFCFKFNEVWKRVSMKTPFVSMNLASPTRPNLSRSFQNLPKSSSIGLEILSPQRSSTPQRLALRRDHKKVALSVLSVKSCEETL